MAKQAVKPSEVADLLFRKYDLHKREVHLHMQHFNVRNFQIVFTLILASGSYFFFKADFKPSDNNKVVWLFFAFVVITISFYLLYDVLDASFQIAVDAERMATLEKKINEIIEDDLFLWESELVELLHTNASNPLFYMIGYALILFGVMVFIIPIFVIWNLLQVAPSDAVTFKAFSIFVICYALGSFVLAVRIGKYIGINLKRVAAAKIQKAISSHPNSRRTPSPLTRSKGR